MIMLSSKNLQTWSILLNIIKLLIFVHENLLGISLMFMDKIFYLYKRVLFRI